MNLLETSFARTTKSIVDAWMIRMGQPIMSTEDVIEMMGGIGDTRIRTVKDAMLRPKSVPYRWFASGMTDESFYGTYEYVYDNWFVANVVSMHTYEFAARTMGEGEIVDVGGTVFNAMQLRGHGVPSVITVNLPGTPAVEFYKWCIEMKYVTNSVIIEPPIGNAFFAGRSCVMAEFFEHFQDVDDAIKPYLFANRFVAANAFCVAAHGHHIPIKIDDYECHTRSIADKKFIDLLLTYDFNPFELTYGGKKLVCCL